MIYLYFIVTFLFWLSFETILAYYAWFEIYPGNKKLESFKGKHNYLAKILATFIRKMQQVDWVPVKKYTGLKLGMVNGLSQFFFIFSSVAFVFCLMNIYLDNAANVEKAEATVLQIEQAQAKIKAFANKFKIGAFSTIILLLSLIALAGTFTVLEKFKIKDKLLKYNKIVSSTLAVLTISTSFTFFGNQLEDNEKGIQKKLTRHKIEINKKNQMLAREIRRVVTRRFVNAILENPTIKPILVKAQQNQESYLQATSSDYYKDFKTQTNLQLVARLTVSKIEEKIKRYDFLNSFEKAERNFEAKYTKSTGERPEEFYQKKEQAADEAFERDTKQKHKTRSESSTQRATDDFHEAERNSTTGPRSKFYDIYKEPIEKLIKKAYSNTIGDFINSLFVDFLSELGLDFAFTDDMIDPIIHEPIQEEIIKHSEKILNDIESGKIVSASEHLSNCTAEFEQNLDMRLSQNESFKSFQLQSEKDLFSTPDFGKLTQKEIERELNNVNEYLIELERKSEWEMARKQYLSEIESGLLDVNHDMTQLDNIESELTKWENFKQLQKFNFYTNRNTDIENSFFHYSKNRPLLKASLGYVVKERFPSFPTNAFTVEIALRAYYSRIGRGSDVERLLDKSTKENIQSLCPCLNKN